MRQADVDIEEVDYLTKQQVAKRIQVTPRTVQSYISRGELKAYRVGQGIRVKISDYEEWMETQRIEAAA